MIMFKISRLSFYAVLLLLLAMVVPVTLAQESDVTDDEVNQVAKDIYCPVCENTPLDVCPTQACADWRELIREKLADGESPQQIFDYFARQYGDGVLANPPQRGVSLVILWILPVVLILLGALVFTRFIRSLRAKGAEAVPAAGGPSVERPVTAAASPALAPEEGYKARVEEELRKRS